MASEPEKENNSSTEHSDIHIVTKSCNHIIQKNSQELIVQQVNENIPNDKVSCEPVGQPQKFQQPIGQMIKPQNIHTMDEFQQQFVLDPVETLKKGEIVKKARSSGLHPDSHEIDSAETQTSDRSDDESQKGPEPSDDWLAGYDEKDGERIDVIDDYDEQESENFMKRRRQTEAKKSRQNHADVASDETRVSIESDAPPSPQEDVTESGTSSVDPTSMTTSTDSSGPVKDSTGSGTTSLPSAPEYKDKDRKKSSSPKKDDKGNDPGNDSAPSDPKDSGSSGPNTSGPIPDDFKDPKADEKAEKGDLIDDKSYVAIQYYGQPGENTFALSSSNTTPPPKSTKMRGLGDCPYDVLKKILEKTVLIDKLVLRNVCHTMRELVHNSKSHIRNFNISMHEESIQLKVFDDSMSIYNEANWDNSFINLHMLLNWPKMR